MAAFVDNSFLDVRERNSMPITLNIHTKSHTGRGRPTLILVERFGNGSVRDTLREINLRAILYEWTFCREISSETCYIKHGKKTSVHRTKNEGWIHRKRGNLLTFTRVLPTENPTFSARFRIGESQYSFHYSVVSFTVNAGKQFIFRH